MTQKARALEDGRTSSTAVQRPAAVPVWLAPEQFEAADFSPDVCVAEYRRYVSDAPVLIFSASFNLSAFVEQLIINQLQVGYC